MWHFNVEGNAAFIKQLLNNIPQIEEDIWVKWFFDHTKGAYAISCKDKKGVWVQALIAEEIAVTSNDKEFFDYVQYMFEQILRKFEAEWMKTDGFKIDMHYNPAIECYIYTTQHNGQPLSYAVPKIKIDEMGKDFIFKQVVAYFRHIFDNDIAGLQKYNKLKFKKPKEIMVGYYKQYNYPYGSVVKAKSNYNSGFKEVTTGDQIVNDLAKIFPCVTKKVTNPMTKVRQRLNDAIVDLNDNRGWSREEIADWIETLDLDIRLKEDQKIVFNGEQVEIPDSPAQLNSGGSVSEEEFEKLWKENWSTDAIPWEDLKKELGF